jgi:hypothetical protein
MNMHLTQDLTTHYNGDMDEKIRGGLYQRGQIGLVVLLIGSVLLTLGIGIASQTVLETQTARLEAESSSVFNVAEKLIERALSSLQGDDLEDYSGFSGAAQIEENRTFSAEIVEGDVGEVDLSGAGSPMTVEWPQGESCNLQAALVVAVIYGADGQNVARYAFDGCSRGNGFTGITCSGNTCSTDVDLSSFSNLKMARIKVLYADTTVTVSGTLPVQSRQVTATATQDDADEVRSIEAERGNPSLPAIFDYALYSGSGDIAK